MNARQLAALNEIEEEVDEVEVLLSQPVKIEPKEELPAAPQPSQEEQLKAQLVQTLQNIPGAPSPAQIEALKAAHGKDGIFIFAVSATEAYVFTYLRRQRWMGINEAAPKAPDPNLFIKEQVVKSCVLFPKVNNLTWMQSSKAGLVDTLFEVIMAHSAFLQLPQAMMLTTQL